MSTAIQVTLPDELVLQAQDFVQDGWIANLDNLLTEALRRYLESHGAALNEEFLKEDVEWGLNGQS